MRWGEKKPPEIGATRDEKRFALLPVRCEDCWVWLEFYGVIQEYRLMPGPSEYSLGRAEWITVRTYAYDNRGVGG